SHGLAGRRRSPFADARHDARRHHRTMPDRRSPPAVGRAGNCPAGATVVSGDVSRRALVQALVQEPRLARLVRAFIWRLWRRHTLPGSSTEPAAVVYQERASTTAGAAGW